MIRITACLLAFFMLVSFAAAQSSSAFTYQGELGTAGAPYTGPADLRYRLYDSSIGTTQIGPQIEAPGTTITNGRFTSELDFASAFDAAQPLWLEIDVRTPAGSGSFTTLTPRQRIAATPLAQAIVGIPISRAGPQAIDQDQSQTPSNSGSNVNSFAPSWQSFTAGKSGTLDQVDVWSVYPSDFPLTVTVHAGLGISGPVLASVTLPAPVGVVAVPLPNIPVAGGSIYTLEFTGVVLLQGSLAAIPGSLGHTVDGDFSWRFRTYVTPVTAIQATASNAISAATAATAITAATAGSANTVPWTGVSGVPANVSSAFSPWSAATGGISYPNGVAIGTSTPQSILHVKSNGGLVNIEGLDHAYLQFYPFGFAAGRKSYIGTPAAGSTDFNIANQISGGTINLGATNIRVLGNFINNSDARDKHDVRSIDNALALVEQLRGVRYLWNEHSLGGEPLPPGEQLGFLAQDVEKILPEAVATTADGRKGISYVSLVPLLAEAIKEQKEKFEAELIKRDLQAAQLAAENAQLKARLDRIEKQLNAAAK